MLVIVSCCFPTEEVSIPRLPSTSPFYFHHIPAVPLHLTLFFFFSPPHTSCSLSGVKLFFSLCGSSPSEEALFSICSQVPEVKKQPLQVPAVGTGKGGAYGGRLLCTESRAPGWGVPWVEGLMEDRGSWRSWWRALNCTEKQFWIVKINNIRSAILHFKVFQFDL